MEKDIFCDACGFIAEYEMIDGNLIKSCRQCGKKVSKDEDIDIVETIESTKYRPNIAMDPTLQRIIYRCDVCEGEYTEMSILLQPETNREIRVCTKCKTFYRRVEDYCIYCQTKKNMVEIVNDAMRKKIKICDNCGKSQ